MGRRAAQDHPRSRGENPRPVHLDNLEKGSPPLTRGKPQWRNGMYLVRGITPAHAGKTELEKVKGEYD